MHQTTHKNIKNSLVDSRKGFNLKNEHFTPGSLIILTHYFPVNSGEEFLIDELKEIAPFFDNVIICPNHIKGNIQPIYKLPSNVKVVSLEIFSIKITKYEMAIRFFPILLHELFRIPSKRLFFSMLKFNLSLLKQSYLRAINLKKVITEPNNSIIYSYWCDDLAITGSFCKLLIPDVRFVSRAHGFDVFEEQSDYKYIFFRHFQLSGLDRLWAVSRAGSEHLKKMNYEFIDKINFQFLGIQSDKKICFEQSEIIRLATCSHIRSIKRLDLMIDALKLIKDKEVEWHVIGNGPDWEILKKLSINLPANCKAIFHGHLSMAEIHALYGTIHFDFLVSLSSSEGLPVSMMEAISHGIPLIATDVGGCREIVNEITGILITAEFSDQELAQIIENCKTGSFNNLKSRQSIISFWEEKFNAKKNYSNFVKEVKAVKDE